MFNLNTDTVSLIDYQLKSPTLAKVLLSFTGKHTQESIRQTMARHFDGLAEVVANSFRIVADNVAVGFVRANQEMRVVDNKELSAKYRVVSSNTFMSAEDRSLWTKKDGAAGPFLVRQGQEDLSELCASVRHTRPDLPGLRHISQPVAAKSELLAFVTEQGEMDYGFAVSHSQDKVRVVSFYSRTPRVVDYGNVVSIVPVALDRAVKAAVQAGLKPAEKSDAIAYWKQLYSYDPDYMQEVIREVNEDSVA